MEINGIPLHPLVVHAAVVFTPLAALTALASLVPAWRARLRWPLLVVALVALASVQLAVVTGENLLETRGPESPLIEEHEERAELLRNVMIGFALLAVGAVATARRAGLATALTALTALVGVGALVLVVVTGDLGAQSVWGD